ncbi:putative GST-like protein YibF [Candidatus Kinetoplastibacterium sorsogonicusi]|uniref:Putative GST-like protein YibF n=1 Tax=Candidatus Kinetoplastidibacterium kentomonadis TaxID=1576550 RepID=A0A3S7J9W4_9PROT|nr:glutathione S-transferase N-terminal domain-containing protein [Candidatus Kinetoplastibacterium sorsogonicusi]AWD32463.1 putative GST-like protein YibF [Candidatus Kinetoplastibacterium sorsogonicusi]
MILLGSSTSPFVKKVRIAMSYKKILYEFQLENVWSLDSKIENYNPLGKIPCLLTDNQESIFDSRVIIEYLDILKPLPRLIPLEDKDKIRVKCLEAISDGIIDASVLIYYENNRENQYIDYKWINRQHKKIISSLIKINNLYNENYLTISINNINVADISLFCALEFLDLRFKDILWRENYKNLSKFFELFESLYINNK